MITLTNADVVKLVNAFCDDYATYAEAAAALRCTPAQLSQTRSGKLGQIPAPILKKLGLKPLTLYTSRSGKPVKGMPAPKARKPAARVPRPSAGTVAGYTAILRPQKGEPPTLKPLERVLSHEESDFDDTSEGDGFNPAFDAPSLHINAFGDD